METEPTADSESRVAAAPSLRTVLLALLPVIMVFAMPSTRWVALQQTQALSGPPTAWSQLLSDLGVEHDLPKTEEANLAEMRRIADQNTSDY